MKPRLMLAAGVMLLLLFGASPAFASSPQGISAGGKHSVPLSLTLQGLITNAGSQAYSFGGGSVVKGSVFSTNISPGPVDFNVYATVHGLVVSGKGFLHLSSQGDQGKKGGHSDDNRGTSLSAQIQITGAVPAAYFPLNCDPTTPQCSSEIPLMFTGVAMIESGGQDKVQQIPIAIESPYWNPFGGPIVITSLDTPPTIFLVVSYHTASIQWSGVQLYGVITGTFGTETVSGSYGQGVNSQENLVSGTEFDSGTIAFADMSDPVLNAHGFFVGHTTVSLAGKEDCSGGFLPKGTCWATGATSDGLFSMIGSQVVFVSGTYHTVWSVPSLFTQTIVLGAVIQR